MVTLRSRGRLDCLSLIFSCKQWIKAVGKRFSSSYISRWREKQNPSDLGLKWSATPYIHCSDYDHVQMKRTFLLNPKFSRIALKIERWPRVDRDLAPFSRSKHTWIKHIILRIKIINFPDFLSSTPLLALVRFRLQLGRFWLHESTCWPWKFSATFPHHRWIVLTWLFLEANSLGTTQSTETKIKIALENKHSKIALWIQHCGFAYYEKCQNNRQPHINFSSLPLLSRNLGVKNQWFCFECANIFEQI